MLHSGAVVLVQGYVYILMGLAFLFSCPNEHSWTAFHVAAVYDVKDDI